MKKLALTALSLLLFQGFAFAASGSGRKVVAAAGTPEALSATASPFTRLVVCADADNTGSIAVGTAPVASATIPQGIYLAPGGCTTFESSNRKLNTVLVDSVTNGSGATYEWSYK